MTLLIVTTSREGAGNLRAAFPGAVVRFFDHRLVSGPVPSDGDVLNFSSARRGMIESGPGDYVKLEEELLRASFSETFRALLREQESFTRIEFWIDSKPNSFLVYCQLVNALHDYSDLLVRAKPTLRSDFSAIASIKKAELHTSPITLIVDEAEIKSCQAVFKSWASATPQNWFNLLHDGAIESRPIASNCVTNMLKELPDTRNGLSRVEATILNIVAAGQASQNIILELGASHALHRVYDYWELCRILDVLINFQKPLIANASGRPRRFRIIDERESDRTYRDTPLKLTTSGHEVLENNAYFPRLNSIHRWWGATCITSQASWGWSEVDSSLVSS